MWVLTPFMIGLFSGFHCIAMCGGLCSVLCQKNTVKNLTMTHLGRTCSYALLGLLFAGVIQGAALTIDGAYFTVLLRSIMGVMLIITGVALWFKSQTIAIKFRVPLWQKSSRKLSQIQQKHSPQAQWLKGMLWGMLPCGLLYGMLMIAATTGSAWRGALFMFFFGLGTVAPLLVSQKYLSRWQGKGQLFVAMFIVLLGVWTVVAPWFAHELIPRDNQWLLALTLVLERCVP